MWRLWLPHLNHTGSSFFVFTDKPDWNKISGCDVAVVQRCCTQPQFDFIKTCRALEMKVVYELDDDIFDIPPENPAADILHRYAEGFRHCMRAVDVLSVSTRTLAKALRKQVRCLTNAQTGKEIPIIITENRLDERVLSKPLINAERLIIGWQGSTSHRGDLLLVEEAIAKLAKEYPKVEFQFRGLEPPFSLRDVPNVVHHFWMPVAEYFARYPQWGWSIAIAPLTDHSFNDAKSCIKMIEAAYCKIPCLASWVRPYDEFCSRDPELRWLLCAGKSSFEPKLRTLINEPEMRTELGNRMYKVMKEHYSWEKPHEGWQLVLDTVKSI
jgi:glycosyltransferase involved in cell wall biosynthesis